MTNNNNNNNINNTTSSNKCSAKGCFEEYQKDVLNDDIMECQRSENDRMEKQALCSHGGKAIFMGPRMHRPKTTDADKLKAKERRRSEKAKEEKRKQRSERVEDVYFQMDEEDEEECFDAIWSRFNTNHATKELDITSIATPKSKLVERMEKPARCDDEVGVAAWLAISALPCPVCATGLRRLIRQQGKGGWHSVLAHMVKCRTTLRQRITAGELESEDAMVLATEVATSAAWQQAKAVVDAAEERKARRSTERAPKAAAATHERVACRICERTFRASDTQSFERHYATCKEKQARRKEYHEAAVEDTQKKVSEAKQDILKAEAIRDDALKNLKKAKQQGQEAAQRQKEQRKREAKMKKGKSSSYVHTKEESNEKAAEVKVAGMKAIEKAMKQVQRAEESLKKSYENERERVNVAHAVQVRADMEAEIRQTPSAAQKRSLVNAKLKASMKKQPASDPARAKSKRKFKESTEAKTTKAKLKTMAKKDRRSEPSAEGMWHQSCSTEFATSRAGKAVITTGFLY